MANGRGPIADHTPEWVARLTLADLYHRPSDPFRPGVANIPPMVPPASMVSKEELAPVDVYTGWMTQMGVRPVVYQRAINFQMTAGVAPLPLLNQIFQTDGFIIDVPSTALNSVFTGYGSGITATSGIEVRAGVPQFFAPDNQRENWEIQRVLEAIAAMLAAERGYDPIGEFRAPRVVMNANEYFVVATAATNISVMLFTVPEFQ